MAAAAQPSYKLRATGSPFESKDQLKARGYRWDGDAKVWFCSVGSEAALADELAWLKAEVYGSRRAQVDVEALDALTRYSPRPGRMERRAL
jgi:DNA polymerase-3 subunit epsilon